MNKQYRCITLEYSYANYLFCYSWTPSPRRARRDQGYIEDEYDERVGASGAMNFVRQEFGRFGRPQSK